MRSRFYQPTTKEYNNIHFEIHLVNQRKEEKCTSCVFLQRLNVSAGEKSFLDTLPLKPPTLARLATLENSMTRTVRY